MCKVLIMSGLDPKKKKLNWQFIKLMGEAMSVNNKDGLGYAAIDTKGNLFGEHWWMNWQAFENYSPMSKVRQREHGRFAGLKEMIKDFASLIDEEDETPYEKYNVFGKKTDEITAITLHTRYATSAKTFGNVHPFVDTELDTSLIHNGVISNHTKLDEIRSTCDSERILNKYLEHCVNLDPNSMQKMIDDLKGNFACGIFSRDHQGNRILDVFKSRARLSCSIVKELGCLVFTTDIDDLKNVCDEMNLTVVSKVTSVNEDTLVRFDPITGKVLFTLKYKDTAINYGSSYPSDGYNYHHRNNQGSFWRNGKWYKDKEEYEDEMFKKATEKYTKGQESTNVIPLPNNTPVKSEAEVIESQTKAAETVEQVTKQVNEVDRIIDEYSDDETSFDGWKKINGMWVKVK